MLIVINDAFDVVIGAALQMMASDCVIDGSNSKFRIERTNFRYPISDLISTSVNYDFLIVTSGSY